MVLLHVCFLVEYDVMRTVSLCVLLVAGFHDSLSVSAGSRDALTLKDGDRVLFLGGALIEHEQDHGFLETRLTQRFPDASITFRNFGWSGDTVTGAARTSGFQNPDGFARLLKEVLAFKPTVIFIGYGMNESFGGPEGLPGFIQGFTALLDQLGPLKARTVILSPTSHEDLGRPYPDPGTHNRHLELYTKALAKIADGRRCWFVDLLQPFAHCKKLGPSRRLTTNGLLPNEAGYWIIASEIEERLFGQRPAWNIELDRSGKVSKFTGAKIGKVSGTDKELRFEARPIFLAAPTITSVKAPGPRIRAPGLAPGTYALVVDGRTILEASAAQWQEGVNLETDPTSSRTQQLRAAIIKKAELFARRWRPFNDHERHWGFIGGDFRLYDMEIAAQEKVIGDLRRPSPLRFEIVLKEKAK
jgi:lysophospholipase L1-like esterase